MIGQRRVLSLEDTFCVEEKAELYSADACIPLTFDIRKIEKRPVTVHVKKSEAKTDVFETVIGTNEVLWFYLWNEILSSREHLLVERMYCYSVSSDGTKARLKAKDSGRLDFESDSEADSTDSEGRIMSNRYLANDPQAYLVIEWPGISNRQ